MRLTGDMEQYRRAVRKRNPPVNVKLETETKPVPINKAECSQILKTLNASDSPLTASEIAADLGYNNGGKVMHQLGDLAARGEVIPIGVGHTSRATRYMSASSAVRSLSEAYAVMVWWYEKRDPKLAELLLLDAMSWRDGRGVGEGGDGKK